MIYYSEGEDARSYDDIALIHWDTINPKTKTGTFNKRESLIGRIEVLRDKYRTGNFRKFAFFEQLLANNYTILKSLIISKPDSLSSLSTLIKNLLKKQKLYNSVFLTDLLEKVFQYDNWRSNGKFEKIFNLMAIKICPYCNHQDVFEDEDRDLMIISCDHYLDKAKHPWLSLSFYNLIPGCKICNETYKGMKSFRISTHIHPYHDNYNNLGKFNHDFVEGSTSHNIIIESNDRRFVNSSRAFGIKQRYSQQSVKAISKAMYYHAIEYSDSKKQELIITWNLMDLKGVEKHICYRLEIPENENEIRRISLGKLKLDLALKYKLLEP